MPLQKGRFSLNLLKEIAKKIVYGPRADSDHYVRYLRSLGCRIGDGTCIFSPTKTLIDTQRPWMIDIGEHVQITEGVKILQHGYDWSVFKHKYGRVLGSCGKVTIGNNVFIGMNSIILKNAVIGDNTIIGAGSVVTGHIPANCVAAGNPCRVIMSLEDYYTKRLNAQLAEATQLVQEYRKVYHTDPGEQELSEFFWLFSNDYNGQLPHCFSEKMRLVGSYDLSMQALAGWKSPYNNLKEFLSSIPKSS